MTYRAAASLVSFDDYGLSVFSYRAASGDDRAAGQAQRHPHTHMEVEMLLLRNGAMTLEFAGADEKIHADEIAVYWGGLPHAVVYTHPATAYHVAQVPIVDLLSSVGSASNVDVLLAGQFLRVAPSAVQTAADHLAFARWSTDLASGGPDLRAIAELEMHARLRRVLHDATSRSYGEVSLFERPGGATATGVASAIRYVVRHFMEDIGIEDVARVVGWHRDHLMESFRRVCGVTLWDYVTFARLTEAKRLLVTTDLPILAICHRVGFSSTSRMYDAFHRFLGATPAQYRRIVRR